MYVSMRQVHVFASSCCRSVHWIVRVLSGMPKQLQWFWFYDTQSNTLSDGNLPFTVNRTTFRESPMMFVAAH